MLQYFWSKYCIVILVIEVIDNVICILPTKLADKICSLKNKENITEIRLRVNTSLKVYYGKIETKLECIIDKVDLLNILKNISSNSIYSVQQDINKGFVTIVGGNRIGIAGEVVVVDGKIKNIKDISSMNIRVAKEFIGIADKVMDKIIVENEVQNTIIVSPPGLGKTTLLRDIIRNLSSCGYNVGVIDERGEIACMYNGVPTLSIGDRTDVVSFVEKSVGMQMVVRSMAPNVVCTDEIGDINDIEAIKYLCRCGVNFITTMHGNSLKDITKGKMNEVLECGYLDTVIVLSNKDGIGTIDRVYTNLNSMEVVKC